MVNKTRITEERQVVADEFKHRHSGGIRLLIVLKVMNYAGVSPQITRNNHELLRFFFHLQFTIYYLQVLAL